MSHKTNFKRKYQDYKQDKSKSDSDDESENSSLNNVGTLQEFYEVEEIVGKKNSRGKVLYQVKWVGYPSDQNTWEPLENLTNVTDLIEEYDKVNNSVKGRKKTKNKPELKNEVRLENLIEKYKDHGLEAIMKNNTSFQLNRSKELTRSTDENEEISIHKSTHTFSAHENINNIEPIVEETSQDIIKKERELIGDIKNDKPVLIKYAKLSKNKMQFLVKWKKRENGFEPFESFVDHEVIKRLYPYVLIDFYESKLRCVSLKNLENNENKEKQN